MVAAYLAFARGEGTEQAQPADLVELVQDVGGQCPPRRGGGGGGGDRRRAGDAAPRRRGAALPRQPAGQCAAACAADRGRGGRGAARGGARWTERRQRTRRRRRRFWAQVTVDDDGPGIPAAEREERLPPLPERRAGRHRPRPSHRARHRPRAWRRPHAGAEPAGRAARAAQAAGVAGTGSDCPTLPRPGARTGLHTCHLTPLAAIPRNGRERFTSPKIRIMHLTPLSGSSGMCWNMMAASPGREMCHAWPACLPARADR